MPVIEKENFWKKVKLGLNFFSIARKNTERQIREESRAVDEQLPCKCFAIQNWVMSAIQSFFRKMLFPIKREYEKSKTQTDTNVYLGLNVLKKKKQKIAIKHKKLLLK